MPTLPAQPERTPRCTTDYWDAHYREMIREGRLLIEPPPSSDPVLNAAAAYFGDVRHRTMLDLGCGRGSASLFFARRGARVISVDQSPVAIEGLRDYCSRHGIANVAPRLLPIQGLSSLEPVDFLFGSMILHHIEPLDAFARQLRALLREDGRGFFFENNGTNPLLLWCRNHLVGRWGIPINSDGAEHPLTPAEVAVINRHFKVTVQYPEFLFFRLIAQYLLGGRLLPLLQRLDQCAYRFRLLRRHSYVQYLLLR
jgi:2-polyprenyl-3-methyl-5-hydroxy-6-metoxy-1,4-benzoquinol methylase